MRGNFYNTPIKEFIMNISLSHKCYMYLYALTLNHTYGPVIPDHVHEYYASVSSRTYRSYFLNYDLPQHVMENVYYG